MVVRLTVWAAALSLAAVFLLLTGWASAGQALPDAQREAIEKVVHDYLLRDPEVLVEALRGYEEKHRAAADREAEQAVAANRGALDNDAAAPVAGNPQGDVTVVEFFDYRCGYCKKALPSVQELLKTDNKVRWVFKEFPILGPDSAIAAKGALAAWKIAPGKYFPFHVALMETRGELSESRVLDTAKKVGIDAEKLRTALAAPDINAAIERNYDLARKLQINGTPAFIVGGKLTPGAVDLPTLREMVGTARAG